MAVSLSPLTAAQTSDDVPRWSRDYCVSTRTLAVSDLHIHQHGVGRCALSGAVDCSVSWAHPYRCAHYSASGIAGRYSKCPLS